MDATNAAMSYLIQNTFKPTDDLHAWLAKYANVLTTSALTRLGFEKAYNSCKPNEVLSMKTEDTGMFGITHNIHIVSCEQTERFLQILDNLHSTNCVQHFRNIVIQCQEDERVVVNVLCNVEKLTDNKVKTNGNTYVSINTFSASNEHNTDCPCC